MIIVDEHGIYADEVVMPEHAPAFVYLTRDADEDTGELAPVIDVWAVSPKLTRPEDHSGPGVCWLADTDDDVLLTRVSIAAARKHWPTLPDTSHECIRIRK